MDNCVNSINIYTSLYFIWGSQSINIYRQYSNDCHWYFVINFIYIHSLIYRISIFFRFYKRKKPSLAEQFLHTRLHCWYNFFIAVAATNLFHQGNWQRVYAAKNYETLRKSLIISFFIIIPIVFYMGFSGMVAFSIDSNIRPDLGFFSLLLKEQTTFLSLFVVILGLSLTISTVDTLINAISSLIIVDGKLHSILTKNELSKII